MRSGTLTVARFAILELVRKRVIVVGLILTGAYLLLFGLGLHFIGAQTDPLQRTVTGLLLFTMGFYLATFLTVLVAGFAGVGAISGEIESGTAAALLAEPVSRSQIILGKFLGCGVVLSVYATFVFFSLWGLMAWQFGLALPGPLAVLPLFILQALVMLALALLGSTIMSTLANGISIFLLYGIVLVAGMVEQIGGSLRMAGAPITAHTAATLINIGIISSLVMPVDALYRRAVYTMLSAGGGLAGSLGLGPFGAVSVPSAAMVIYAVIYLGGCLLLAVRSFRRRSI